MLAISEAFLARLISGVSGPTSMPFPLISVSKSFLYCLCEDRIYRLYSQNPESRVTSRFFPTRHTNLGFRGNQNFQVSQFSRVLISCCQKKHITNYRRKTFRRYSMNVQTSINEFLMSQRVGGNQLMQLATVILQSKGEV